MTINNIISETYSLFGDKDILTELEVAQFINIIIDEFKYSYPEFRVKIVNLNNQQQYTNKLYLNEIDTDILTIKGITKSTKHITGIFKNYSNAVFIPSSSGMFNLFTFNEVMSIQLYNQYINDFTTSNKIIIPDIFNDNSGRYIYVDKNMYPLIVFYTKIRTINPQNIDSYLYNILRYYVRYRFFEIVVNEIFNFIKDKTTDMYKEINDIIKSKMDAGEDFEIIKSISLGSISISFDNILEIKQKLLSGLMKSIEISNSRIDYYTKLRDENYQKFKQHIALSNLII